MISHDPKNTPPPTARPNTQPVSPTAVMNGMQPAFQNRFTGESHLAQDEFGRPAANYSFHGLPDYWVVERDSAGLPMALHPDIVPGYWRDGQFIALGQLNRLPLDS